MKLCTANHPLLLYIVLLCWHAANSTAESAGHAMIAGRSNIKARIYQRLQTTRQHMTDRVSQCSWEQMLTGLADIVLAQVCTAIMISLSYFQFVHCVQLFNVTGEECRDDEVNVSFPVLQCFIFSSEACCAYCYIDRLEQQRYNYRRQGKSA